MARGLDLCDSTLIVWFCDLPHCLFYVDDFFSRVIGLSMPRRNGQTANLYVLFHFLLLILARADEIDGCFLFASVL